MGQAVQAVQSVFSGQIVVVGASFHRRITAPCQLVLEPRVGGAPWARIELTIEGRPMEVTIEPVPGVAPSLPRWDDRKLAIPGSSGGGPYAYRHDGTLGQLLVALAQANKRWIIDREPLAIDVLFMALSDCRLVADRPYPQEVLIAVEPIGGIREVMARGTICSRITVVSGTAEDISAELLLSWKTS